MATIPPGRAGRRWLVERLEIAARGADLLDRKRRALVRERARLQGEAEHARGAWQRAAAAAALWSARAALLDGADRLDRLARHAQEPAALELAWSNLMGARVPVARAVAVPEAPELSALGASTAAVLAARAAREATAAAARHAACERAAAELASELARSTRRLRALQRRWIPEHEAALARLDLALDEGQREHAVRVRWLTARAAAGTDGD